MPAPEVIAAQIVEDATAGIEAFAAVARELEARQGYATGSGDDVDAVEALIEHE